MNERRITTDDLLVSLLCAIDEYGENMNLKLTKIKEMHERLAEGGVCKIGYNPMPDGQGVIISGLIGEEQVREWLRLDAMLTHFKTGSA